MLTRRRFAFCGVALLSGLGGCGDVLGNDPLREVHLALSNRTDDHQTFHFALEASDGLGGWHDFSLDAGANQQVVVEPDTDREWLGYHAVADDKQVSGTLLGQAEERTCLQLDYRIEEDDIVALMPTNQPLC